MSLDEQNLIELLERFGFTHVVTPITQMEKLLNKVLPGNKKYKPFKHQYWVDKTIRGVKYEIYHVDCWYTQLRVGGMDGKVMFDGRRFENMELLKYIPGFEMINEIEKVAENYD